MSLTEEETILLIPMLEILARRPETISLRAIYFAITASRLEELKDVQQFYSHCLGNHRGCDSKKCLQKSFLKSEFDPFWRQWHDVRQVEFDGTPITFSTAQYNFFRVFISSGNLAKIVAHQEKIEAEMKTKSKYT